MAVEVDQSGKIEQLDTSTIVACSNGESSALCIKPSEKRLLFIRLRTSVVSENDRLAIIFSVLVFLLLRTFKKIPSTIILDEEYTGKNDLLCNTLEKLLLRQSKGKWRGIVRVQQIGKHSPAHYLAWGLHRKTIKRKNILKVTAKEILRWWQ